MVRLLDCTLRDGGYYNAWDFSPNLVQSYLDAMVALKIDYVEIGLRSLINASFKGGFFYSKDTFLQKIEIPDELNNKIGVMINASELAIDTLDQVKTLESLFKPKAQSPISLVRVACHINEFETALPASNWLKGQGYKVGFTIMQIADCSDVEILRLAELASRHPIDVLYFADSMGSLDPGQVKHVVSIIRKGWFGDIGIHTHDNMGQALVNAKAAVEVGVTWVDSTVTGMGRGAGNAQTEYLVLALERYRAEQGNITKLLEVIRRYFKPLQDQFQWGTNPYYYLAGQYGIHPSYIQEMLSDSRFNEEDLLAAIEHLRVEGGKKYRVKNLDAGRHFYSDQAKGTWNPQALFKGKDVLILGTGPGVEKHRIAIEDYIRINKPVVLALNTQSALAQNFIDVRIACHPIRLLADCEAHVKLPQPLITPASMLPTDVVRSLQGKVLYDYGLKVQENTFGVEKNFCIAPTSLVVAYALATLASGRAKRVLLAGFDGYSAGDRRNEETTTLFESYQNSNLALPMFSITPTKYRITCLSVYGLLKG